MLECYLFGFPMFWFYNFSAIIANYEAAAGHPFSFEMFHFAGFLSRPPPPHVSELKDHPLV